MLRTGCYVKQMKSIQILNPSSVIYVRAQVNSSTISNICWLIQTFKYQCYGFQVHFKSMVYDLKTKGNFWPKCPHYIMGNIINWGSTFSYFHWFRIWHISIIHCAKFGVHTCSICDVVTIPIMLVPRYSTGLNVAKLFLVSVVFPQYRQNRIILKICSQTGKTVFLSPGPRFQRK